MIAFQGNASILQLQYFLVSNVLLVNMQWHEQHLNRIPVIALLQ